MSTKALELADELERVAEAVDKLDKLVGLTSHKVVRYVEAAAELRRLASVEAELAAIKAQPVVGWVSEANVKWLQGSIESDWIPVWNKPPRDTTIPLYALPKEPT